MCKMNIHGGGSMRKMEMTMMWMMTHVSFG